MAGIERKYLSKHQQKQQNRYAKPGAKEILHRAACPNPSVLSYTKIKSYERCGDAPSQGHRRWFCILYRSSWSWRVPG